MSSLCPIWTKAETQHLLLCGFYHFGSISRRGHDAFLLLSLFFFFFFLSANKPLLLRAASTQLTFHGNGSLAPSAAGASSLLLLKDAVPLVQSNDRVVLRRHLRSGEGYNADCAVICTTQAAGWLLCWAAIASEEEPPRGANG